MKNAANVCRFCGSIRPAGGTAVTCDGRYVVSCLTCYAGAHKDIPVTPLIDTGEEDEREARRASIYA